MQYRVKANLRNLTPGSFILNVSSYELIRLNFRGILIDDYYVRARVFKVLGYSTTDEPLPACYYYTS